MSNSEESAGIGRILVEAPLGVEISIANGAFQEVATGVSRLEENLRDGVYVIRTAAAGRSQQQIVRLQRDQTLKIEPRPSLLDLGCGLDQESLERLADYVRSSDVFQAGAGFLVLIYDPADEARFSIRHRIQLRTTGGVPADLTTHRLQLSPPRSDPEASDVPIFLCHVAPGAYTLSFETFERKIVRQTVYAIADRTTFVLLQTGSAGVIESGATNPRIRKRRGIDPSLTLIASIDRHGRHGEFARDAAAAEVLLYQLRTRGRTMDQGFADALARSTSDPYVQLYTAAASLASPGRPLQRLAAALESTEDRNTDLSDVARTLGDKLCLLRDWPDVRCLWWRLAQGGAHFKLPVSEPPSLEIAWRWVAAATTAEDDRHAVGEKLASEALGADPGGSPWFVLGTTASGGPERESGDDHDLSAALLRVSGVLAQAVKRSDRVSPSGVPAGQGLDLSLLSPESGTIARALLEVGGTERWSRADGRLVGHLAASLATPATSLGRALRKTADEVGSAIERRVASDPETWASDPHKGRFGGVARTENASVRLGSFEVQHGIEFLELNLIVEGPSVVGPVIFYLHPTFSPSTQRVFAAERSARLRCYAWGGFTLGVELSDGRKLELDLAQLSDLPAWFRGR